MTRYLPPNLISLFQASEPLPYLPPPDDSKKPPVAGVTAFLNAFKSTEEDPNPPPPKILTKEQRKALKRERKHEANRQAIEAALASWNPKENPKAVGDAYKTLFLARLAYDVDEETIRREFEAFGPIRSVSLVRDLDGKSRGYAFVEYERESDMKRAYKEADSKRLGPNRGRLLADVERGRTVAEFKPRRLGGGIGYPRPDKKKIDKKARGPSLPPRGSLPPPRGLSPPRRGPSMDSRGPPPPDYRGGPPPYDRRGPPPPDYDRRGPPPPYDRRPPPDYQGLKRGRDDRDERDDRDRKRYRDDRDRDRHRDERDRDRDRHRDTRDRDRHRDDRDRHRDDRDDRRSRH